MPPLVLRWYWWRFNGWGFAFRILAAFSMAVLQKVIQVNLGYLRPDYAFFPLMTGVSFLVAVTATVMYRTWYKRLPND